MSLGNLHGDGFDGLGCVSQIGWRGKHWREKERWHTVNLPLLVNHDFLLDFSVKFLDLLVISFGCVGDIFGEKERWHTVNLLLLVNHDFLFARFLLGLLFTAGNGLL